MRHRDIVKTWMDETQPLDEDAWFEEPFADSDFPSGRCIGTREHNDKCVFLNKDGRCVLQLAGEQEGLGKWGLKPFYCIAFPITVENGVVKFDDVLSGEASCCAVQTDQRQRGQPVVTECDAELKHVLGAEGYMLLLEELRRLGGSTDSRP